MQREKLFFVVFITIKRRNDFLATGKNDNLLIFNRFNLFYLFWEGLEGVYDKKRIVIKNIETNNRFFLSL